MKKILFFGMMAALLLGTASCSSDMEPSMGDDMVRFTIELPGNIDSRAISDGLTANKLTVAVYDEQGNELPDIRVNQDIPHQTTVSFKLVKGQKYSFAFWAQAEGAPYTFNTADGTVSVSYENAKSNDETRDAFYWYEADLEVNGPIEKTIYLYRPFCQLNFGASDYQDAIKAGVNATMSAVTVKKAANLFNLKTGESSGQVEVTFTKELLPNDPPTLTVEGNPYQWMAMNYFLVPNNEATIETSLQLYEDGNANAVRDITVPNVPVKKNHRTNIVGNLFTEDVNFNVIIDENFDNVDYDIINGELMLKNAMTIEEINGLIANRGGAFALAEDLDLTAPIVVPEGVTATLNLNGHKINNTNDIWAGINWSLISVRGGNLTINGNGQVFAKADDCYALDVCDGGNLVINGGDYNGNISALYVYKGHAEINGGSFTIQQLLNGNDYRFELNLYDASRRDGTASIVVKGGKFYMFDPANNLAEGVGTNFVAAGYETVLDGDWYEAKPIQATMVSTDEKLEAALKATGKKNISVKLTKDLTLSFGARTAYGDANTANIIIDGNGHTLNLKGTDGDWSSMGAMGAGNLIIKNATVNYTSKNTASTWNGHDLNLVNRVADKTDPLGTGKIIVSNVKFNTAVSIANDAEFENVTIEDANTNWDIYALWIQGCVANVSLKDCTIISTNGRAVTNNPQYVSDDEQVLCTMNIENCKFVSKNKGAIYSKNKKGLNVTANGYDISEAQADPTNLVWNSDDSQAAWDLVVVSGCTKYQEK